ncbi:MAG: NAD-dependent epimerase/dehydratase family protein [Acidimicrobiales bacterium]|nr:NAD-dependent epimerase/dehydratase family protein [Acidimicrobiales bacterium]
MKVLVMGGTNFNGLALVHELVHQGHDVSVLNRGRSEASIPDSVTRLVGDRSEPDTIRAALAGTEWDVIQDVTAYHPEDVELMIELFRDRVGHYIFASSTVTYAASGLLPITEEHPDDRTSAQNEYGLHKLLCEDVLWRAHAEHGFPATSVPFSMVFGPHNMISAREQAMFRRVVDGRPVIVPGDGETLLQVGHVDDQAKALTQMMGNSATLGRRYNLTGAEFVTRNHYVATIAAAAGGDDPDVRHVPHETMEALWTGEILVDLGETGGMLQTRSTSEGRANPRQSAGAQRFQLAQLVQHLAPNIHHWNASTVFSIDRLRADVGWEPEHTFASMVEDTFGWWRGTDLPAQPKDWTFEDNLLGLL